MKPSLFLLRSLIWTSGAAALVALSGCQTLLPLLSPQSGSANPSRSAAPQAAGASTVAARSAERAEASEPQQAQAARPAARAESAGMVAPLVEKRETLTATGYAVISVQNHRNPAQQRLMAIRAAKLEAYRSLAEQVYGQQLDATTTGADMVVQSDSFRSRVEGVIYGAVLVSITPTGDDTYETTLSLDKAVVQDLRALYLGQIASRGR
ncbi:MAG: LPP20 family lipoprotein [Betaproteobacteria bacterium]